LSNDGLPNVVLPNVSIYAEYLFSLKPNGIFPKLFACFNLGLETREILSVTDIRGTDIWKNDIWLTDIQRNDICQNAGSLKIIILDETALVVGALSLTLLGSSQCMLIPLVKSYIPQSE